MAHYYTIDGEPRHTQPTKKGAKNPDRPTTIKDAKEQGLFPSVTEYIKQLANAGLQRYQQMQVALAAAARPLIANENLEEWANMVIEKAREDSTQAADLGTAIHDALESYYAHRAPNPDYEAYVTPTVAVVDKLGLKTGGAEMVLVNPEHGYAGTTDLVFKGPGDEHGILDFKSQRFDKKPGVYPSHVVQLAAYHMAFYGSIEATAVAYNIYISTVTPGLVVPHKYGADELRKGWEEFELLLALYRIRTGFDPRQL